MTILNPVYVQFSDATETDVVSVYSSPQDSTAHPNQGTVDSTDPRYVAFVNPTAFVKGAQSTQAGILGAAAAAQIAKGAVSSALGAPYTYPLDLPSQSNLQAAVMRMGMTVPPPPASISLMCADVTGTWARRPHTPAQVVQAGLDAMSYIVGVLAKLDGFQAQVQAAANPGAALTVAWVYP